MTLTPILEFLLLNTLSAAAWASLIGSLGFIFGQGPELLLGDIRHYEIEVFAVVLLAGLTVWLIHHFHRHKE